MDNYNVNNDTICAIATAPAGALGVIRVSGKEAISIVSVMCKAISDDTLANTSHFTTLRNKNDEIIDEVVVTLFRAPHSYTGEDVIELSCHGSSYIMKTILEQLVEQGCRMAQPGEFTQRAFLNGKMDLSQAEAVADLIAAHNKASHNVALSQLRGNVSSELSMLRDKLLKLTSLLELELDFSDHEDLEFADRVELLDIAQTIEKRICTLAKSFETGQALKQGIPVAIIGKTNVGKSTLLNQLLKDDRAIVSDVHGTTRDTIEDNIDINGINFRFIDTAGIRQTSDEIEKIGINRTYQAVEKARIIIWMIENDNDLDEYEVIKKLTEGKKLIVVRNKIDKTKSEKLPDVIDIAAKYGTNMQQLEREIYNAAELTELDNNDIIITSARHYEALTHAQKSINNVISGIESQLSGDLISEDLRQTLYYLAEITGGQITTEETLSNIFKNFCVGK